MQMSVTIHPCHSMMVDGSFLDLLGDSVSNSAIDDPSDKRSAHHRRRQKAAEAWGRLRSSFIATTVSKSCIPPASMCVKCNTVEATVRCQQCGPLAYFCEACTVEQHCNPIFQCNMFHTPELWINVRIVYPPLVCNAIPMQLLSVSLYAGSLSKVQVLPPPPPVIYSGHVCAGQYKKLMVCIDSSGKHTCQYDYYVS